ncbi:MAG: hypothetical protein RL699_1902 [Bacteroidota bacterium]|jgi:hypothetical protein
MKKLIFAIAVLVTFSVNAQNKEAAKSVATEQTLSNEQKAVNDVTALVSAITVDATLKTDLYTLMLMKYEALGNTKATKAEREASLKGIEQKLLSGLNEVQRKQLISNSELFQRMTH